jgi:hypothetical protein
MKLAKIGMIDAKQLGRFTAGQAAHDFLGVGREVGCALRVKVRREKLCVVPDGNVQVLLSFAHRRLDSWARFLCDRALFFEAIAQGLRFVQALSKSGVQPCNTHKSDQVSRSGLPGHMA